MRTRALLLLGMTMAVAMLGLVVLVPQRRTGAAPQHGSDAPASEHVREARPGLSARAAVSLPRARATAVRVAGSGTIRDEMLEQRGGRLVYVFEVQAPGGRALREVIVDATTGEPVTAFGEMPPGSSLRP